MSATTALPRLYMTGWIRRRFRVRSGQSVWRRHVGEIFPGVALWDANVWASHYDKGFNSTWLWCTWFLKASAIFPWSNTTANNSNKKDQRANNHPPYDNPHPFAQKLTSGAMVSAFFLREFAHHLSIPTLYHWRKLKLAYQKIFKLQIVASKCKTLYM